MQAQLREVDAAAVGIRVVYPTEESTVRHRRYFKYETPSGCDRLCLRPRPSPPSLSLSLPFPAVKPVVVNMLPLSLDMRLTRRSYANFLLDIQW